MSALRETGEPQPAAVRLARAHNDEIALLAGAVVAMIDENRRGLTRMAEMLDLEPPAEARDTAPVIWARERAKARGRTESIEKIRAQMDAVHVSARRQSGLPAADLRLRTGDGSAFRLPIDENDLAHERARLLASRGGQAARHAEMAAKGRGGDATDSHMADRAARAAMYAQLQREGS